MHLALLLLVGVKGEIIFRVYLDVNNPMRVLNPRNVSNQQNSIVTTLTALMISPIWDLFKDNFIPPVSSLCRKILSFKKIAAIDRKNQDEIADYGISSIKNNYLVSYLVPQSDSSNWNKEMLCDIVKSKNRWAWLE